MFVWSNKWKIQFEQKRFVHFYSRAFLFPPYKVEGGAIFLKLANKGCGSNLKTVFRNLKISTIQRIDFYKAKTMWMGYSDFHLSC